jgi:hypothetical protein
MASGRCAATRRGLVEGSVGRVLIKIVVISGVELGGSGAAQFKSYGLLLA